MKHLTPANARAKAMDEALEAEAAAPAEGSA